MKLINYQSKWLWGFLWINHTVLVSRGYVLSYMFHNNFQATICWRWACYLYNEYDWARYTKTITSQIDLPDIDLIPYKGIEKKWVYCFEALIYVYKWKKLMETVKNRTLEIIKWMLLLIIYTIVVGFLWFIANDTIENMFYDVKYIDNLEELCL